MDGSLIITSSDDAVIKFWDARSGAPLASYNLRFRGESFLFSQDGTKLLFRMQRGVALFDLGSRYPAVQPIVQLGVVKGAMGVLDERMGG